MKEKIPSQENIKQFESFKDIPKDPKQEGLRPNQRYAGGYPEEIIAVAGKNYKKEISLNAFVERNGRVLINRPFTEKEYYSHSTDEIGPGPGWDMRRYYLEDGWDITDGNPKHLSDLPLYNLVPIEE